MIGLELKRQLMRNENGESASPRRLQKYDNVHNFTMSAG